MVDIPSNDQDVHAVKISYSGLGWWVLNDRVRFDALIQTSLGSPSNGPTHRPIFQMYSHSGRSPIPMILHG